MAERPKKYTKKLNDAEKVIKLAKERYKRARDSQSDENLRYKHNTRFTYDADYQWPTEIAKQRKLDLRPVLSVNRQPVFVRAIVNNYKQNPSAIKVLPADDGADKEVAEIYTGRIRNIEQQSGADQIKGFALGQAVAGNKAFYRVITQYEDNSFNQDIFIKAIVNATSVTYDCDDVSLDGSGWQWCFIEELLSVEEFESRYPDEDTESWPSDNSDGWTEDNNKKIRIAEYFYIEKVDTVICQLEGGEVVEKDDVQESMVVLQERTVKLPKVKWCILGGNAKEPLETREWAGKYIPVVPVWGDQVWIDGKRRLLSAMEYSQDSQRMINFGRSTEIELLGLQNKAPFMVTAQQVENYEEDWKAANSLNMPYLKYNADPLAPPPMRQGFAAPPSGVLQGVQNASQDLMDTSGIQEAGLGMQSNETSGKAINARAAQGQNSVFHFLDNVRHADRYCGMILVDLIPHIDDVPKIIRVLGEDGSESMKAVNQDTQEKDDYGQTINKFYDMTVGKYDVVIQSGPAFASKRQEAQELIAQAVQGNPAIWQTHGDLIFKAMDIPYADEFSERSKKTLPEGLVPPDDSEGSQMPPQVQAQIQGMQEQMQQMDAMLQQQAQELQSKQGEEQYKMAQLQLQSREIDIKEMEAQAKIMQAAQKDNVSVSAEVPHNPETDYSDADKLELEIETRLHEAELKRKHEIKMEVLRAKLANKEEPEEDDMIEMDDMGEDKPSEMACHMASIQEGLAKNQEITMALVAEVGKLAEVASAPKKLIYDKTGKIIGSETVG